MFARERNVQQPGQPVGQAVRAWASFERVSTVAAHPRTVILAVLAFLMTSAGLALELWLDPGLSSPRNMVLVMLFVGAAGLTLGLWGRTRQLHARVDRLEARAFLDRLTGVPNRPLLLDRLAIAMSIARRNGDKVAVLFIDLDGFKSVNDKFGHSSGDEVLRVVARRLVSCVRSSDTVARVGGDEFVVLLGALADARSASLVADKILHAVCEPIRGRSGAQFEIGASIGISVFPDHGAEIDRLLSAADAAMYQVKLQGKRGCAFHKPATSESAPVRWLAFEAVHETGIEEIDHQHRQLMDLGEHLNSAVKANDPPIAIRQRFEALVYFVQFHFATEERLMQAAQYPERANHVAIHANLLTEVADVRERLDHGVDLVVLQILKDWLVNHIESSDKDLGVFLKQRGMR